MGSPDQQSDSVRPKRRWWLYAVAAALLVAAGLFLLRGERKAKGQRAAHIRQLLAIIDDDFQRCTLGELPPTAELAKRELTARTSGKLTAHRARSCAEIAKSKLEPLDHLRREDTFLDPFFGPIYVSDSFVAVGVCEQVRASRTLANKFNAKLTVPSCHVELPTLEPTLTRGDNETRTAHIRGDAIVLDVSTNVVSATLAPEHVLRSTVDGKEWTESPPVRAFHDLFVDDVSDAFSITFANENENARYFVYAGHDWHKGMLVPVHGFIEEFRRTSAGWTLVTSDDTPNVLRLDATMDHVLEKTPIPELAKRWEYEGREATIDDAGNVAVFLVTSKDKAVEVESHVVPVGGKPERPVITKIDHAVSALNVSVCRFGATAFLVIAGAAVLKTTDGGRTFTQIPGGHLAPSGLVDCNADHIYVADDRVFTACTKDRCITQDLPLPSKQDVALFLNMKGDVAQVFVTAGASAFLLSPRTDTGELEPVSIWRWNNVLPNGPLVRLESSWFAPRGFDHF